MRGEQWLTVAGVATWLVCGLLPILEIGRRPSISWPAVIWLVAFGSYGAALMLLLVRSHVFPAPRFHAILVAVQSVTGLAMTYVTGTYLGGTGVSAALLVVVAAELPHVVTPGWAWTWVGVQAVLLMGLFVGQATLAQLFSMGIAMGGFQLFAVASSLLARREEAAREELATANTELLATRALLAENSRVDERLRISRDLHDTLGHHLTALSLQLDVASRLSEGKPADHIRQAHAITRLLLGDVRDVVNTLRETSRIDVARAIRALAVEQAGVAIHLDLPATLGVEDTVRAETLVRCVQEIITNTARHARAHNLWIRLEARSDGITLHARDDGRGADTVTCGNGLTGMRERFEQYAGHVEFEPGRGAGGFEVRAFLPTPATA